MPPRGNELRMFLEAPKVLIWTTVLPLYIKPELLWSRLRVNKPQFDESEDIKSGWP